MIRLQEKVAEMLGKQAGLFVPGGTMSNTVAVRTHTQPGDEIVAEEHSPLYVYEGGDICCFIRLFNGVGSKF